MTDTDFDANYGGTELPPTPSSPITQGSEIEALRRELLLSLKRHQDFRVRILKTTRDLRDQIIAIDAEMHARERQAFMAGLMNQRPDERDKKHWEEWCENEYKHYTQTRESFVRYLTERDRGNND